MATKKVLDEEIRQRFLGIVSDHLTEDGEEVLRVKSNEICLPVTDSEGNEKWIVMTFKVPVGEDFDGYVDAESYQLKQQEKAEKAKEKARKAAEDKKKRAEAKAVKEAQKAAKVAEIEKAKAETPAQE